MYFLGGRFISRDRCRINLCVPRRRRHDWGSTRDRRTTNLALPLRDGKYDAVGVRSPVLPRGAADDRRHLPDGIVTAPRWYHRRRIRRARDPRLRIAALEFEGRGIFKN